MAAGAAWQHLPAAAISSSPLPLAILDFGPKQVVAGRAFNAQPDGNSALWLRISGPLYLYRDDFFYVRFNAFSFRGTLANDILTATIPPSAYAASGRAELYIENASGDRMSPSETIEIGQ